MLQGAGQLVASLAANGLKSWSVVGTRLLFFLVPASVARTASPEGKSTARKPAVERGSGGDFRFGTVFPIGKAGHLKVRYRNGEVACRDLLGPVGNLCVVRCGDLNNLGG